MWTQFRELLPLTAQLATGNAAVFEIGQCCKLSWLVPTHKTSCVFPDTCKGFCNQLRSWPEHLSSLMPLLPYPPPPHPYRPAIGLTAPAFVPEQDL